MTVLDKNSDFNDNKFHFNKKEVISVLVNEFGQQFSVSKSVREQHTDTTTI